MEHRYVSSRPMDFNQECHEAPATLYGQTREARHGRPSGGGMTAPNRPFRFGVQRLRVIGTLAICSIALQAHAKLGAVEGNPADLAPGCNGVKWSKLVKNGFIIPHWIGHSDEFWYAREVPSGVEYIIVSAATGRTRRAFQQSDLTAALTKAGAKSVDAHYSADQGAHRAQPQMFPGEPFIEDLTPSQHAVSARISLGGEAYECKGEPLSCARRRDLAQGTSAAPNGLVGIFTRSGNLWLRDLKSGEQRPLTRDGEPDAGYGVYADTYQSRYIPRSREETSVPLRVYWAPNSQRVIVSYVDQRMVKPYPYVDYVPPGHDPRPRAYSPRIPLLGERPAAFALFVFDLTKGTSQRLGFPYEKLLALHTDDLPIHKVWWTKDSRRAFALANASNMSGAYLFEVDPTSGNTKVIVEEHDTPWTNLNSNSYAAPNVRMVEDGREAIWFSERDGWSHLYLYDVANGKLENQITRGPWVVRDIVSLDEKRRVIYFTASGREPGNPYYQYLYRANFDGSGLKLLTPERSDHLVTGAAGLGAADYDNWDTEFDQLMPPTSPDGKYVVYSTVPLGKGGETTIRTTNGDLVSTFEKADTDELYARGYRDPEEFVVKAADGVTPLWGVLYEPVELDGTARYPVVDVQYASFLVASTPRNLLSAAGGYPGEAGSLDGCGFAVVSIDARGTAYRSREFSRAGYRRIDTMNLEDHIAAIKQLAQRFPWLDADRVGIWGASYGGWTTVRAMLRFPDFFKAGVAGVFIANWEAMYPDYEWLQYEGEPQYGGNVREPSHSAEHPTNWAHLPGTDLVTNLKGRLMLVIDGLDENVPPGGEMQFVDSLVRADKDFDLVFIPSATHGGFVGPYMDRRFAKFFQTYLGGVQHATDVATSRRTH